MLPGGHLDRIERRRADGAAVEMYLGAPRLAVDAQGAGWGGRRRGGGGAALGDAAAQGGEVGRPASPLPPRRR